MSDSTRNKMRKKREPTSNSVSDFINKIEDQPAPKKAKKNSSTERTEDPDESLKLFKAKSLKKPTETGTSASTSNAATNFIDESKKKAPSKPRKKTTSKPTTRKAKGNPDIRKVFGKQEEMFNYVVAENCLQEGIDPEEMQLALAISESLKDQKSSDATEAMTEAASSSSSSAFENPFASNGKVKPISVMLERFGFKCKKIYSEYELDLILKSNQTKRSKFKKLPTALTRTSLEKRNEIIQTKIDRVLAINSSTDWEEIEETKHEYIVSSFYLQELEEKSRTIFKISSENRPTENILLEYYVTDLFEPSFIRADHLLKDWSEIPGRDPSPDRSLHKKDEQLIQLEMEVERTAMSPKQSEVIIDSHTNDTTVQKERVVEDDSCTDIFADLAEYNNATESIVEDADVSMKDKSGELAEHLEVLQVKLSQSTILVADSDENKSVDSDQTIENSDVVSHKLDLLGEDPIGIINEISSEEMEAETVIDLTQRGPTVEGSIAIPFDDSYYSLQQHLKKLGQQKSADDESSSNAQNPQPIDEFKKESFTQVDLVSTDEDTIESPQKPNGANDSDDEALICSQNSLEDENDVIDISDEEVNYSTRFHNIIDSPSDESLEGEVINEDLIDLTQIAENSEEHGQFEINNIVEQSLAEIIPQDDFNIDNSVSNLLDCSLQFNNHDTPANRSKRNAGNGGLSESIQEIMSKYCVQTGEKEKSRSFRKMQSDTNLIDHIAKRRKTNEFGEGIVDLTQQIDDDDQSAKENEFLNFSIHLSLENIMEPTPARQLKQTQSQARSKKKSLGVDVDSDYIVDTASVVVEPDFQSMTPVELKQALFKYGIRPLPVRKAISLLEYIYDQLHPKIRVAADEEIDINDSRREMNITDIATNIGAQEDENYAFQLGLVDDEEIVLPKMRKSKTSTCAVPLHISFYNMVRSNEKIQNFILEFRPIELDRIHKHFRKFGLSYQPNDIIAFLDKRCITFKTKEQSYSKIHERKQQKRAQRSQQKQQKTQRVP